LQPPSYKTIRNVVALSICVTLFHFTDNFIYVDEYPQPGWINAAVVVIAWLLFTAVGIAAVRFYKSGNLAMGQPFLFAYAFTGISSLGHFMSGPPSDFTTRGLVSIFMDGTVGLIVLGVAIWSILATRQGLKPAT
jgi:hypothetical protein